VEAALPSRLGYLAGRGAQKDAFVVVLGVGVAGGKAAVVGGWKTATPAEIGEEMSSPFE